MKNIIQASRGRRGIRSIIPKACVRRNRSWRAAAIAMSMGCALSACGGGGGRGQSPDPNTAAATPTVINAVVNTWGDSTMAGYMETSPGVFTATSLPAADLQAKLQTQLGVGVTVVANAVPGSTLEQALAGGNSAYQQSLAQVLAAHPEYKIVLSNYGINDRITVTPEQFRQELIEFITTVQSAGKTPVLEEPNPICDPAQPPAENIELANPGSTSPVILPYVLQIDSVAVAYNIPLVQTYFLDKFLTNWCALLSDGEVHPGPELAKAEAGNRAIVVARALTP